MSVQERQETAAIIGLILFFIVPIIVLLGCLGAIVWWGIILGHPGAHDTIYGWLTSYVHTKKNGVERHINNLPWSYLAGVATAYLLYQLCELIWFCYTNSRNAIRARTA